MGLHNNKNGIYVRITNGKFAIKTQERLELYDNLSGKITSVQFKEEEYENKKYEAVYFQIKDGIDTYLLKMRTNSGYFRSLCNSLKSGDPLKIVNLTAFSKTVNGRSQNGIFVSQNGKTLKWKHTKDNMGDLPELEMVTFKGKQEWDNTKQIEYWKGWLTSINFENANEDESKNIENELNNERELNLEFEDDLPF